ncbi:site-specific DNA-methyltransferase [Treponema sp.]|uniref:site-specific DNA-methyltransferase n=1 Tax=Treponema sp. TaxID=166 RepID=UPI003F004864
MNKPKFETPDMTQKNIDKISQLFPNCITEAKDENGKLKKAVNFELLQQMLSDEIADKDEAYEFTWVGKNAAIVEANKPIRKTLRPCKEESVDWDKTENLYIEGDNLEVLKLLQESYLGKVKMIYIDPPYNTGNDFIYRDDFAASSEQWSEESGQYDEEGNRMFKNTDTNGRFHSDWCSMIYSRLLLARNLLSDDGVIFISIDDNEQDNLKKICDEVFGLSNYIGMYIINSSPSAIDYGHMAKMHEYCLMYCKNMNLCKTYQLNDLEKEFKYTDKDGGFNIYPLYNGNISFNPSNRPNLYYPFYVNPNKELDNGFLEIGLEKKDGWVEVYPVKTAKEGLSHVWRWGKELAQKNLNGEIVGYRNENNDYRIVQKSRLTKKTIRSLLMDTKYSSRRGTLEVESLMGRKMFSFPKPTGLLKEYIEVASMDEPDAIILDFFSGSATTAHAVMQLNAEDGGNRKFIMVQLPEVCDEKSEACKAGYKNICEIGKERIRRAGQQILNTIKSAKDVNPEQIRLLKNKEQADLFTANAVHEETENDNITNENSDNSQLKTDNYKLDIGFRVLKVDDSNMKDVYYAASEYDQGKLEGLESNIKEDRNDLDLLFGCLLDWGLPLSLPYTSETIGKFTVHTYNNGDLVACFNEDISEEVVKEIARKKPLRAVFRDSSFSNSASKINVFEIFKMISPETSVKVI